MMAILLYLLGSTYGGQKVTNPARAAGGLLDVGRPPFLLDRMPFWDLPGPGISSDPVFPPPFVEGRRRAAIVRQPCAAGIPNHTKQREEGCSACSKM